MLLESLALGHPLIIFVLPGQAQLRPRGRQQLFAQVAGPVDGAPAARHRAAEGRLHGDDEA